MRYTQRADTKPSTLIKEIIRQACEYHYVAHGHYLQHQETYTYPVGGGGIVTLRGTTNFERSPWAVYDGIYGHWQATLGYADSVRGTPKALQPPLSPR
jgi:hypothetical protein